MQKGYDCVTKAVIYDFLEAKYYGNQSYIVIDKEWFSQFEKDFFSVVIDSLEDGCNVEFHRIGSFKVKPDKNAVVKNTVIFVSSKDINDNAVDSGNETITEQDLVKSLTNHFFKSNEETIRFARRGLVESITVTLELIKVSLIEGKRVSISGIGTLYVETGECYSSKIHQTRMRTRALLEPAKELIEGLTLPTTKVAGF